LCGPFIDTAAQVIDAALRASIHYLDVAAEQAAVLAVFERFASAARDAGVVVAPAMGFYGGLGDLLATAAMGEWDAADEICIAIALDSWKPTQGTRLTGQRNPGRHFIFSNNRLERADPPPARKWNFPAPFGAQDVVGLSLSETITISQHLQRLRFARISIWYRLRIFAIPTRLRRRRRTKAVAHPDIRYGSNRSRGRVERRAVVRGRDIYAITAPIVVEATHRVVNGLANRTGVVAAGEAFAAQAFLTSLSPTHLSFELHS